MILIWTHIDFIETFDYTSCPSNLFIIDTYDMVIKDLLEERKGDCSFVAI